MNNQNKPTEIRNCLDCDTRLYFFKHQIKEFEEDPFCSYCHMLRSQKRLKLRELLLSYAEITKEVEA